MKFGSLNTSGNKNILNWKLLHTTRLTPKGPLFRISFDFSKAIKTFQRIELGGWNFQHWLFSWNTLSGLIFAWINFRNFRVFWTFSRNFVHTKFMKLQFLPKSSGKLKKLGEKQSDSRNLVHTKINPLKVEHICKIEGSKAIKPTRWA